MSSAPFKLTPGQRTSAAWAAMEAELKTTLQRLRERNDAPQPPEQTAHLRGQIAQVKAILRWAEDLPPSDDPPAAG